MLAGGGFIPVIGCPASASQLNGENLPTTRSDAHEIQSFYQFYCKEYIQPQQNAAEKADGAHLKAYQTAQVLFEVLKAINLLQLDPETLETGHDEVAVERESYRPYNILPLGPHSANSTILKYPEIRAALNALCYTRGLHWPDDYKKGKNKDIMDWLQVTFGFQKDNAVNQKEHLILLLGNVHIRQSSLENDEQLQLDGHALQIVMEKFLKNYKRWCEYLGLKKSLKLSTTQEGPWLHNLLYTGLYLLIWGEASNLRFMPECLCYIFHHMAAELSGMLTGEVLRPAYGGEDESFLERVVTPIYEVIRKEAEQSKLGKSKHSTWRNYDDLNEYFWSVNCFQLGWPMAEDADFFHVPPSQHSVAESGDKRPSGSGRWIGKANFVEIRTYWHIFRSFDRFWNFLILCLQAMIIIAWNGSEFWDQSSVYDSHVFKKVLSVFITASILKFGKAALDAILSWKARHNMTFHVKLRYILKAISAAAWVIILPVTYAFSGENHLGFAQTSKRMLQISESVPSLYILAVFIYLLPNMLSCLLFLFPFIQCSLEKSNKKIFILMMWWSQPQLYVGRAMYVPTFSLIKYTMFWVLLIASKLAFSYYLEIKPLVGRTKDVMRVPMNASSYKWHDFFPHETNNIGVVIAIWAPIILVYFMDAQIWYSIFSTLFGGLCDAFRRLREIQTLESLRSRFHLLPGASNACLLPQRDGHIRRGWNTTLCGVFEFPLKKVGAAKFAQLWNEVITSFREEDLISNREMDLLLFQYCAVLDEDIIQWPLFLLVSKINAAVNMAKNSNEGSALKKSIERDDYMSCAVKESYASFKIIIQSMVQGDHEKEVVNFIFSEVDKHIEQGDLIPKYKMSSLPSLYERFVELMEYLSESGRGLQSENIKKRRNQVVSLFKGMLEIVTKDIIGDRSGPLNEHLRRLCKLQDQLFASPETIKFPPEETEVSKEKIKRLHLLLTVKESAVDVPSNLEARRRITFFSNSLFMDMPLAPEVRKMLSFSVLTPYYNEDVLFSLEYLKPTFGDEVSILSYLQMIFSDEWKNFLERVKCDTEDDVKKSVDSQQELCLWASYRGQTLARTVRGMMYYRKALELQALLDGASKQANRSNDEGPSQGERSPRAQCQELADMKFTYVVSCQLYGIHKRSGDPRAADILRLMVKYPALRVAYIDIEEQTKDNTNDRTVQEVHYSVLVKAASPKSSDSMDPGQNLDQVVYKIKLPGSPFLGEGKPENQNNAIIFTRGEGLQTIDMNQDNYLEEALKMRNLLQEFLGKNGGAREPTILGLGEHIFSGSLSSVARFTSTQENSFVTMGQRFLANPLKVRFHYGHPDVFDRLFHLTRGGVSKACKVINLSEDIFAGFNSTLRDGNVTHHQYIQVGKGRDMGLNQISMFEAKVASGNGEQTLSRDLYRLGQQFDFFRMLSCYFTTIGSYINNLLTVLTVYAFLYGQLYLVLSGLEERLGDQVAFRNNKPLQVALASQSFVQAGFLMALPMFIEIGLGRGFRSALTELMIMQSQMAPVFFTFSLGTRTHYYGRTLLHGGAKYRPTGRGFVVSHTKFAENYRMYSRSHFVKSIELMVLLIICEMFSQTSRGGFAYTLISISMWLMVGAWLFAPFLFNPFGFEWQKIVDDWYEWKKWIYNGGGISATPERSWESWWEAEQEHLRHTSTWGTIVELLLASRFFMYQYWVVYHLNITKHSRSLLVYFVSWALIFFILVAIKAYSAGRDKYSPLSQMVCRFFKAFIFMTFAAILVILVAVVRMAVQDIIVFILAFIPTGWALLLIAQALKPLLPLSEIWSSVKFLARSYDIVMGLLIFAPVAFLAWLPFLSEFQTRVFFNQAFNRGLQTSRVLGWHRKLQVD